MSSFWIGLHVLLYIAVVSDAYKILVVFPIPSKSHSILGNGVVQHLLNADHEVTYITAYPWANPPANLNQVDVSSLESYFNAAEMLNITKVFEKTLQLNDVIFVTKLFRGLAGHVAAHENVQNLLMDPKQQFDAVIAENVFSDIYSGFAQIYECPYIIFTPVDMSVLLLPLIDEVPNPAYTNSLQFAHLPPFTFVGRVKELFLQTIMPIFVKFMSKPADYDSYIKPVLQKFGRPLRSFEESKSNISLILQNSHVSMGYAAKLPLNMVNIGGYHIKTETEPLPKNLQELMDNSKEGVIYFSMGSNLKSKDMPEEIKISLIKMFGSLKQTVLWKFEENFPNLPSNVKVLHWAPQPSILAHPNCVLFITHGGLLSTTETIHYGVPVIGIPVFGDQFVNVDQAVAKGFAKRVDLSYSMADDLKVAIDDILRDPQYKQKIKELSFIYHHRPTTPGKLLVHEVEHVILTKGALHLRSPQFLTPWYQKMYLDLVALLLVIYIVLSVMIKKLCKVLCSKKANIHNKKKKS